MGAASVGSRGAGVAKGFGVAAGAAIRKARDSSIGADSAHWNLPGLCACNGNCGHHKIVGLVVVNNVRVGVICDDG